MAQGSLSVTQKALNELHESLENANNIYDSINENMRCHRSKTVMWYFLQGQFFLTLRLICQKSQKQEEKDLYSILFHNEHKRMNYISVEITKIILRYPSLILLNVSIRKFIGCMAYIRELAKKEPENEHLKVFAQPVEYVSFCYKNLPCSDKVFVMSK